MNGSLRAAVFTSRLPIQLSSSVLDQSRIFSSAASFVLFFLFFFRFFAAQSFTFPYFQVLTYHKTRGGPCDILDPCPHFPCSKISPLPDMRRSILHLSTFRGGVNNTDCFPCPVVLLRPFGCLFSVVSAELSQYSCLSFSLSLSLSLLLSILSLQPTFVFPGSCPTESCLSLPFLQLPSTSAA